MMRNRKNVIAWQTADQLETRSVRSIRRAIVPIFFTSGACALIYQVIWVRQLSLVFGVSVFAISAVLGAFMGGLAIGSYLLGRLADRVRRPVGLYGLLQAGIGLYALLFPWILEYLTKPLFVWAGKTFAPASPALQVARLIIAVGSLILPTSLMGGTFPVMSRFFIRIRTRVGQDLSLLYAVDTAGAVAGTLIVGFILLAFFGITVTLYGTALVNFGLAAAALLLSRKEPPPVSDKDLIGTAREEPITSDAKNQHGTSPASSPLIQHLCLAAILLSGFASLAYEVLWTRVLVFYTHNSTFAFSAMLATVLFGLSAGSWLAGRVLDRIRRRIALFGYLEISLAVSVVLSVLVIERLPALVWLALKTLGLDSWRMALLYIFGQTALVLLLPAMLLGAIFPLATRIYTTGLATVGRKVGAVYSANTLGAIFGSFAAGFVMIPLIGVRASFLALIGLNFLIGALLLAVEPGRRIGSRSLHVIGVVVLVAVCWMAVPPKIFYQNYEKAYSQIIFYKEEASDTVMVAQQANQPNTRLLIFSDGRGTAGIHTTPENRFYGHLPMLLHPDPQDVLVICFGVGNTLGAISRHPAVKRIDCAELSPGVVECSRYFPTNYNILNDPRVHLTIEDGRNFLLTTDKKYDVIELEPPEIHTAGVVNLYTKEFLQLCREHLKPGGILNHWLNLFHLPEHEARMLVKTVQEVFPHTTVWQGPLHYSFNTISSDQPLAIDLARFRREMAIPSVHDSLAEVKLDDPYNFLSHFLLSEEGLRRFTGEVPLVTDDHSRVDFSVPRSVYSGFGFGLYFSPYRAAVNQRIRKYDPMERGGRLNLMLLSLNRESVAPLIGEKEGHPSDESPEGRTRSSFKGILESTIEKRKEFYRSMIENDPDREVLKSWGVEWKGMQK